MQLTNGSSVTVDDAFLRETILNPSTHITAGYAPIMPTYQGQVSEEGLIDLVEYIKNLNSNYRIQQTLLASQLSPGQAAAAISGAGPSNGITAPRRQQGQVRLPPHSRPERHPGCKDGDAMNTTITLPDQQEATLPKHHYLNDEYGLKSWLLTHDHKRIALLYLVTIAFFFVIGGTAAALIRLELLTPAGDLVASDTYNKLFSIHGIIMVFFFLVPIAPAVLGNFLIPIMIGAKDVAFPKINLLSYYLFVDRRLL